METEKTQGGAEVGSSPLLAEDRATAERELEAWLATNRRGATDREREMWVQGFIAGGRYLLGPSPANNMLTVSGERQKGSNL